MSMHRRPVRGRRTGLAAAALAVAALTTLGASAPALAAKGSGGGKPAGGSTSSSLKLATPLVYDANGDTLPNWGDTVTFDISTTSTTPPYVDLVCTQNGATVLGATSGFFDGYLWPWTKDMNLASQSWTGGAADCTATLYTYNGKSYPTLATASFGVLA